jgi:DNA/RNA-binding domain of Phe-tRNA-synthetase-like protein
MTGASLPVVRVAPELADIVALGALTLEDLHVAPDDTALHRALEDVATALRAGGAFDQEVAATRRMYRRLGLDPTRTRPSSEALLRRVRKGAALPRINTLVDVCNWCSVEFQVPYGLYDLDRIRGDVELRTGHEGEAYDGIRKETVHVGGRPTLADEAGAFGNPTSDSRRTMVTADTSRALVIVYAPREAAGARLEAILDVTAARAVRYARGREGGRAVIVGRGGPRV